MKTYSKFFFLLVLVALIVAACGPTGQTPVSPAPTQPGQKPPHGRAASVTPLRHDGEEVSFTNLQGQVVTVKRVSCQLEATGSLSSCNGAVSTFFKNDWRAFTIVKLQTMKLGDYFAECEGITVSVDWDEGGVYLKIEPDPLIWKSAE